MHQSQSFLPTQVKYYTRSAASPKHGKDLSFAARADAENLSVPTEILAPGSSTDERESFAARVGATLCVPTQTHRPSLGLTVGVENTPDRTCSTKRKDAQLHNEQHRRVMPVRNSKCSEKESCNGQFKDEENQSMPRPRASKGTARVERNGSKSFRREKRLITFSGSLSAIDEHPEVYPSPLFHESEPPLPIAGESDKGEEALGPDNSRVTSCSPASGGSFVEESGSVAPDAAKTAALNRKYNRIRSLEYTIDWIQGAHPWVLDEYDVEAPSGPANLFT